MILLFLLLDVLDYLQLIGLTNFSNCGDNIHLSLVLFGLKFTATARKRD